MPTVTMRTKSLSRIGKSSKRQAILAGDILTHKAAQVTTAANQTRIFRSRIVSRVLLVILSWFLIIAINGGIAILATHLRYDRLVIIVLPLVTLAACVWAVLESFGARITTDQTGVVHRWGTTFRFAWDEVARWHLVKDAEEPHLSHIQFEFENQRRPYKIFFQSVETPGFNDIVQEIRRYITQREVLCQIEAFRWKAVATGESLTLSGNIPGAAHFQWSDIRTWHEHPKQQDSSEACVQIEFNDGRPPIKVGDAFVTTPTWERLLHCIRTHAAKQEIV